MAKTRLLVSSSPDWKSSRGQSPQHWKQIGINLFGFIISTLTICGLKRWQPQNANTMQVFYCSFLFKGTIKGWQFDMSQIYIVLQKHKFILRKYILILHLSKLIFFDGAKYIVNLVNCKKNNKIKKQIFKCLPNLWETLIEVQIFHSICLRIGVKVKSSTLYG